VAYANLEAAVKVLARTAYNHGFGLIDEEELAEG
jgi:hypothetical protein